MIKFFRRIRYNLMSENKTGKYFKYAIGEIVLVMIGILLALQVNNWNEGKKEAVLETYYLNRLIEDLEADISEINTSVGAAQYFVVRGNKILQFLGDDYVKDLGNNNQKFAVDFISNAHNR